MGISARIAFVAGLLFAPPAAYGQSAGVPPTADILLQLLSETVVPEGEVQEVGVELRGCFLKLAYSFGCAESNRSGQRGYIYRVDLGEISPDVTGRTFSGERSSIILPFGADAMGAINAMNEAVIADPQGADQSDTDRLQEVSETLETYLRRSGMESFKEVQYCDDSEYLSPLQWGVLVRVKGGQEGEVAESLSSYIAHNCSE